MAADGGQWGEWWTLPRLSPPVQEGGGVAVVSDHDAVLTDLSVSELFREGVAEVPCPIGVGGSVLPGSSRADHVKAHLVSFRLVCLSIAPIAANHKGGCATLPTGRAAKREYKELPNGLYHSSNNSG